MTERTDAVTVDGEHAHKSMKVTHAHRHEHQRNIWIAAGHDCRALKHIHHVNGFDAANGVISHYHTTRSRRAKAPEPISREFIGAVTIRENDGVVTITLARQEVADGAFA